MIETSHCAISIAESVGDGPVVLLIHGNSSCKEVFRNQLEGEVGRKYRLIAMDLPGHGASEDAREPERTYNITGYADCADEVLAHLGIDSAVVMGWSLGGHVGLDMIGRHPVVRALMISGTPPIGKGEDQLAAGFLPSEHMGLTGQEVFSEQDAKHYARATCGVNAPLEDFLLDAVKRTDGKARVLMLGAFAAGQGADQREIAETAQLPLAVVNGGDEPFVNNDFVKTVDYANLWDGRVHILDGIGHAPFWEAPDQFDPIFERFLADVTA
jgi:pimeloyl-ACP methyl ester carboxylesterase